MSALTKDTRLHIRCGQEVRHLLEQAAGYARMSAPTSPAARPSAILTILRLYESLKRRRDPAADTSFEEDGGGLGVGD